MKQKTYRILFAVALLMSSIAGMAVNTRQALQKMTTAVRASYSEPGHGVAAINDGAATSSSSYWSGYRDNEHLGQWEYVEYDWATRVVINRAVVNWLSDADRLLKMKSLLYWALRNMLMFDCQENAAGSTTTFPVTL